MNERHPYMKRSFFINTTNMSHVYCTGALQLGRSTAFCTCLFYNGFKAYWFTWLEQANYMYPESNPFLCVSSGDDQHYPFTHVVSAHPLYVGGCCRVYPMFFLNLELPPYEFDVLYEVGTS